jgi:SAM-dependent methyltransferase
MLDIASYRMGEAAAKRLITSWRYAQIHHVEHFEKTGFPVRVNSVAELGQMLDAMQDNRFEWYMGEMGGLTQEELDIVVRASEDAVRFQLMFLPKLTPVIPLATLMSCFMIYKNVTAHNPKLASILEIGPGCGYLSLFLKNLPTLRDYSQIEACESFYLLQNLINMFSFGIRFHETAFPEFADASVQCFANERHHIERSFYVEGVQRSVTCTHYPWWRIGEIMNTEKKFDVITSNANLLEFHPWALEDYLTLIERALAPNGIFYVQCTGYPVHGWTIENLFDVLAARKLAALFYVDEHVEVDYNAHTRNALLSKISLGAKTLPQRKFARGVMVLVGANHPLYGRYAGRENYRRPQVPREEMIASMFFAPLAESRKIYSKSTLADLVRQRFR